MKVTVKADPTQPGNSNYFVNVGEAVSQAIASIFGLNANLTFSAYCGYWQTINHPLFGKLYIVVNFIMSLPRILQGKSIDRDHCKNSWENIV